MALRFRVAAVALWLTALSMATPSLAQQSAQGLAPADEYFGRYRLSVLGIANVLRQADERLAEGANTVSLEDGPLALAVDAIHDWEAHYPNDPGIARDLIRLENVYLHAGTERGRALANNVEAWIAHDYPSYAGER